MCAWWWKKLYQGKKSKTIIWKYPLIVAQELEYSIPHTLSACQNEELSFICDCGGGGGSTTLQILAPATPQQPLPLYAYWQHLIYNLKQWKGTSYCDCRGCPYCDCKGCPKVWLWEWGTNKQNVIVGVSKIVINGCGQVKKVQPAPYFF